MRQLLLFFPLYKWGNWDSQRLATGQRSLSLEMQDPTFKPRSDYRDHHLEQLPSTASVRMSFCPATSVLPCGEYCWYGELIFSASATTLYISEQPILDFFNKVFIHEIGLMCEWVVNLIWILMAPWRCWGVWARLEDAVSWVDMLVLGLQRQS